MSRGMNIQVTAGKVKKVETRQVNDKTKSCVTIEGFAFRVIAWDVEVREGDFIFVVGRVQTRSYDKDGEKKYVTEVIARQIVNLNEKAGNLTIAIGNLGRAPEMRYTGTGKAVANFSVAAETYGSDDPEWFNITAWEKLAEICDQHLNKGDRVAIAGRLNLDSWDGNDGQKHFRTKLTGNDLLMLGGNGNGSSGAAVETSADADLVDDIPF